MLFYSISPVLSVNKSTLCKFESKENDANMIHFMDILTTVEKKKIRGIARI